MSSSQLNTVTSYISPNATPGRFRQLGSTHLHLDVEAKHYQELLKFVRDLEKCDIPSKVNLVHGFIGGPQRADSDLGRFYDSHTPVNPDSKTESFGIFSTSLIETRHQAIAALGEIFNRFGDTGGVAEYEQVVGIGETEHRWRTASVADVVDELSVNEVGRHSDMTAAFEIHHGFNITTESKEPPIALNELVKLEGTNMGGWFLSIRGNSSNGVPTWAYRSNSFAKPGHAPRELRRRITDEARAISTFLKEKQYEIPVSTTLERTLGVWSLQKKN